ncbi:asparagine synthase (glutamine-hydrolyzing) [Microvirga sp. M2]|uniref:asparagine synthase (glutamine-hydrolyzing) n=1 Tax=Microvirga sp. M2 TaxID=3073270 RepID=UPI0039C00F19
MCGIFGWCTRPALGPHHDFINDVHAALEHRGPDSQGHYFHESGDWHIGIAHTRLAIIECSEAGSQPMALQPGRVLSFNGEIYNYIELRNELPDINFRGGSDTEVLWHLLNRFGTDALSRLRGMFAFAFWDEEKSELLLARDHFGKKPLFYSELPDGGIVFGSEIAALLRYPGIRREMDADSTSEYFRYRYVPGPNTFFKGIKKLPPGSFARWRKGKLSVTRFYTPPFQTAEDRDVGIEEADERFRSTFETAVKVRLRSDAPYGVFLSGGIDSAAVLSEVSRAVTRPVRTFTAVFSGSNLSELSAARETARFYGSEHNEHVIESGDISEHLVSATRFRGAPVSEPSDIPIYLLSRMASRTVKMVLTGEGSDELLGGYPKHRAEPYVKALQGLLPSALDPFLASLVQMAPYKNRGRISVLARALSHRDPTQQLPSWFGALSSDECRIMINAPDHRRSSDFPFSARTSGLKRHLFFDQTSWLPDNLLERGDRMMMAHSIEGRMPFMDVELARCVADLPTHHFISSGQGKRILRRALGPRLPPAVLNRRKIGFKVPVDEWFRGPLKSLVHDTLCSPAAVTRSFYKRGHVAKIVDEHEKRQRNHEKLLWTMLTLEIFCREYKMAI